MAGLVDRHLADLAEPELAVAVGGLAAQRRPAVELAQEDAQRRGLDLVEPRVGSHVLEDPLGLRAVEAQHADALGELGVVDRDEAAVAEAEEVLRRVEAERRGDARAGDLRRAEGLGRVLDHRDAEAGELRERRRPAEEVDGEDRLRARRDLLGDALGIEVQRDRVDVREDGRRPARAIASALA